MKRKVFFVLSMIFILSFNLVFADEVFVTGTNLVALPSSFSDVPSSFWANESIERWKEEGVITGYEDNTYKPDNAITRAEFIALLDRIFIPTEKADLSNFKDVDSNAWYYDSLAKAYSLGIINGYSDTELGPNKLITRQEAMTIVSRLLAIKNNDEADLSKYKDESDIAPWAEEAIRLMTSMGLVNGYEDGTIKPNGYITRAETAKILHKTFTFVIREPGIYDLGDVEGSIVIVSDGVEIINANVDGGIYLGASIKKEDVVIKDSKINSGVIDVSEKNIDDTSDNEDNEDNEEKKSSSRSTPYTHTINIITSGDTFVFDKEGITSIKDFDKLTITIEGVSTTISEDGIDKDKIKEIIDLIDDDEKIIATAKKYVSNRTVQSIAYKVLGTRELEEFLNKDPQRDIKEYAKEIIDELDMSDLIKLANVIVK